MISEYAPFVVIGLAVGSVYAIAALGLVLTYKTSGIFNFAHGSVGAASAFLYYVLSDSGHVGLPWPVAVFLAVPVFGTLAGLLLELLGRSLAPVPIAMKIVGTIGLLLAVRSGAELIFGATAQPLKSFLPRSTFPVAGVFVTYEQLITGIISLLCALGLFLVFKYTKIGSAMRAVVDDPDLLDMTGVDPVRVRRAAWALGSVLASLAGVLVAPLIGLDALLLTLLVVQAFGAAAVGRFTSLPLTYLGGLLIGVLVQLAGKWTVETPSLSSIPVAVPFLVLFVVLLVTPRDRLTDLSKLVRPRVRGRRQYTATGYRVAVAAALVFAGFLLLLPSLTGTRTIAYTQALCFVGVFLSLGMLVRLSGQVSLCQVGFMAVGAAAFGHLASGLPFLLAVVVAGLAAVPFGAVVAIPAIRLSGLYLALATFGYGILLEQVLYPQSWLFNGSVGVHGARPDLLGFSTASDRSYYYVVLAVVALMGLVVLAVERSRLGRLLRALGDSPTALSTSGTSTNITRVLVFCLASFLAGVSGALSVPVFGTANGGDYPAFTSLVMLAVLAVAATVGGAGSFVPALLASAAYIVTPVYFESEKVSQALPGIFGLAAVLVAVTSQGAGPARWLERAGQRSEWRLRSDPLTSRSPVPEPSSTPSPSLAPH
ncbi:MAG: putative Sulfate-transporting ATPase [Frankiales bacterium]|nr:putative Sulfate-transporting ATPase [Frankiales bacterium]